VIAIYFYNASLVIAFSVYMISGIILHLIQSVIIYKILKKEKITFEPIDLRKGFNNFVKSTWISFSYIMDSIGTNGLRMIISLLANPASLVIFTTIRTITNMIMHGMGTIRDSFLIDIMSHISKNDTKKMNISFEFYYIFIAIIVFPFLIILQFFVEDIYNIWTLGNIQFHFKTYTILIIAVLISCIGLPFRLIVTGNNLIKTKFLTSLIKNSFLILFIIIFYKEIKILSFSIGLLLSELIELIINYFIVNNFFKKIKFNYNKKVVINTLINLSICCVIFVTSSFYNISVSDYNLLVVYCVILYLLNTLLIFKRISFNTIKSVKKMLNK
jgi:O-antigen/teichoic acid export membrane protein